MRLTLIYPCLCYPIQTFHCNCIFIITGIDFIYHPLLYHNHSTWIETILPIFQFLISSFQLKCAFLFSHHDPNNHCPFATLLPFVQSVISSWHISTHLVLSNNLGDTIGCSRSFLYLSPPQLHSNSFFTRQHPPPFSPNSLPWLSSTFNTPHFRLLLQKI